MARTKKPSKQLPRKSKPMEKGKKGGSKTKNRRNDKEIQKKSAVQENVVQNENILERSVHPSEDSITQKNATIIENTQVEDDIFDDETNENVQNDLTKNTVDNEVNEIGLSETYKDIKSKLIDILSEKIQFFEKYGGVSAGNGKCYFNDGCRQSTYMILKYFIFLNILIAYQN